MFSIQSLQFPRSNLEKVKKLYLNLLYGRYDLLNSSLILHPNSKVSFNSYLNSFYESYWKQYTTLSSVILSVKFKGDCVVSIYRDSPMNGCYLLLDSHLISSEMKTIELNLSLDDLIPDTGRIFIDIDSRNTNTEIESIEFCIPDTIEKKLSIGLCTFNKEDFLCQNLESLLDLSKKLPNLSKIIIVNQGNLFSNKKLVKLIESNPTLIQVYKQDNLGGAGGFTRTLYEASQNEISDLHLLMDDDIILDANVIKTAFCFASLSKKEIAVGGQMLDLLRPNFMHEYGGKLDDNGNIKAIFHNLDVADMANFHLFNKVTKIDYNAWWFCMIPTKKIAEINLPAPIFIRGDDLEYGLRLKNSGVETVGLPGVALWHEPFYAKIGGWQTYYDFRNRMILTSSYEQLKSENVNKLFLKIYNLLLCHDYQSVKLILEAINDFAKGTALFDVPSNEIHKKVSDIAKKFAPVSLESTVFNPTSNNELKPKWISTERRINFAKQTMLLYMNDFSKHKAKHLWDRDVAPQNVSCKPYIKTNGIQSYLYLYSPDKETFRQLLSEILKARKTYINAIKENNWSKISEYKEFSFWKTIFS
ncbi:UDP-galactofuranosyl transferase GlfT2 [Mannheimia haemolytica]|uniref:UDP-galactofuranosyl transferase GlfT2 n=1 Tax=Mannheimia haemolytica TaxID=75985 RepID=A0A3S5B2Q5_MANHA|nr:glycosyltransferase [Mannheimia haemolytica]UQX67669.1 glycosyltransferase [Mannheimia haemolytica]STY62065.1 UDP-galactofuranosyl transferase GlfT2 [Mannheimia haemolytica]VEI75534.1 UDP-galactofuranosyl transferase GlfT2 [Mannheimia haemolytica]